MLRITSMGALAGVLIAASMASAATVVEWQFNDPTDQALGGTVSLITPVSGMSTTSSLLKSGGTATANYYTASTGINPAQWQAILTSGYLQTARGSYNTSAGLITPNNSTGRYSNYMGFSGFGTGTYASGDDAGKDKGGTAYVIFRPDNATWGSSSTQQRALFGVGYNIGGTTSGGAISLYQVNGALTLQASRGETAASGHNSAIDFNGDGDNKDVARVEVTITPAAGWDPTKWYFVAASWKTGAVPVLYLRELDPSSVAMTGTLTPESLPTTYDVKNTLYLASIPTGIEPNAQPFAIGSTWYDAGGGGGPAYGLGGDVAYGRVDNVFSTTADMDAVFQSLQIPEPATMALLGGGALMLVRRK